jgi:hypothetical protein
MPNTISPSLLNDTLQLVQLAREVALSKGAQEKADRLSPVVKDLRSLVSLSQEPKSGAAPTGILAQSDFKSLLQAAQKQSSPNSQTGQGAGEKSQMVMAMAEGNMSELEIARNLGMTRDEVRLVLSISKNEPSALGG